MYLRVLFPSKYRNLKETLQKIFNFAFSVGTYRIRNNELLYQAVDHALEAGYRLFGKYNNAHFYQRS